MLKWILNKFRRNRVFTASGLMEPPIMGSTYNWSGPEIQLESKYSPISMLICDLLSEAKKKQATEVKLELIEGENNISVEYISEQASEKTPSPGYLWSYFVTSFPKFSSIELCRGIISEPETNVKWRFEYSKEKSQILLSMIEGD
ncbi:MAG: hypothetical protein GXY41_08105 [Phycisphaerae bacterium]|nr:hypothetical protein [Phycisphaerae bacterium]